MVLESHERVDPAITDPELYRVVFENERVRVLEYRDTPGARTHPHNHPDSVMVTLSGFQRRVSSGDQQVDLALEPCEVRWIGAQSHTGENIGTTDSWAMFVELKAPSTSVTPETAPLGPGPR